MRRLAILLLLCAAAGCTAPRPEARRMVNPLDLLEDLSVRVKAEGVEQPTAAIVMFATRTYEDSAELPDSPVAVYVPNYLPLFDELEVDAEARVLRAGVFVPGSTAPRWDVLQGEVIAMSAPLPIEVRLPARDERIRVEALTFAEWKSRSEEPFDGAEFQGQRLFLSRPGEKLRPVNQWPWIAFAPTDRPDGEPITGSYLGIRMVRP